MNTRLLFCLLWLTPLLCKGASFTSYFYNVEALTNVTARSAVNGLTARFTNSLSAAGFDTLGTTNATLIGNLRANGATLTNGITAGASTFTGAIDITGNTTTSGSFLGSSDVRAGSTAQVRWTSRAAMTSPSDGVIRVSNAAATDFGRIQYGGTTSSFPAEKRSGVGMIDVLADDSGPTWRKGTQLVEAKTADYVVLTTDSRGIITNEGTTAIRNNTLPGAAAGLTYTFIIQDADGLTVTAAAGDTIRIAGSVSGAAGNISATTIGNTITIVAINATEWIATAVNGTWTVSP